jgi:hypothetical protein
MFLTSFDIRNGRGVANVCATPVPGKFRCVGFLPVSVFWQTLPKAAELSLIPAVGVLVPSRV